MARASNDEQARQLQLLDALEQILAISPETELGLALDLASGLIGHGLEADMVDVFFHDTSTDSLVAVGSPTSALSRQTRATGLDRLAMADGGLAVKVFRTGESILTGDLAHEPDERRDVIDTLKMLSAVACRISSDGTARGVLQADSAQRDWFSEFDLRFLEAVSAWVALFAGRYEIVEQHTRAALEERTRRGRAEQGRLTPREIEAAILVAGGLTNDEIAVRLVLVRGTVANHIIHVLRKLGFTRRVEIATWSVQHGLWEPPTACVII